MGNPAAAFLAGFAAVDQLETNRASRKFLAEKRSRLHTLWEREDEAYERMQLDKYRADKLTELEGILADVMNKNTAKLDSMDPAEAQTWAYNEALKRMTSEDKSFGEHFARAVGIDAADGEFVRDKTAPISTIGVVGATRSPNGKPSIWFEVDSVNGLQPMTENRSARGDDKVDFRELGMAEMVKVFGKGVLTNDLRVAGLIRAAVGGETYDGNPTSGRGNKPDTTKPPEPTPEPELAPPSDVDIQEAAEVTRNAQDFRAAGVDVDALRREADEVDAPLTARKVGEVARSEVSEFVDDLKPIATTAKESAATAGKYAASANKSLKMALVDPIVDFYKGLLDVGEEETAPVIDKPVENVAEITNGGGYAAEYVPTKIAKSEAAAEAAIEKGPIFASSEAAEAAVERTLATKGRPTLPEMYNAVGLAKLKVISPAQLTNYARTGQFDAAATRKLQAITSDGITTILDLTGDAAGQGRVVNRVQTGKMSEDISQEDIYDLQSKYTKNKVIDWDTGKPSAAGHERLMTNLHAANRLLGFNAKQQSDRTNMDWMAKGQSYVDDLYGLDGERAELRR